MDAAVDIVEVGPRDGLQNEARVLSTADKVDLIARLVDAGARRIEAASFVNPRAVPAMADGEAVMAAVPRRAGVSYIGLVLNRCGFDRAVAAGVDEVNVVVACTDGFSTRNQGCTVEQMLATWADIAPAARAVGMPTSVTLSVAFGCPFDGEVPVDQVVRVAAAVAEHGPGEIAIADTIGVGVPTQVRALVAAVRAVAPGVRLRAHFHNTRNTGYANAVAALEAGVTTLDASVGGIGGCPFAPSATGNIATEDLVYLLDRMGVSTGLSIPGLVDAAAFAAQRLGHDTAAMIGRAGVFPAA